MSTKQQVDAMDCNTRFFTDYSWCERRSSLLGNERHLLLRSREASEKPLGIDFAAHY